MATAASETREVRGTPPRSGRWGFRVFALALGVPTCAAAAIGLARHESSSLEHPAVLLAWVALVMVGDVLSVPLWGGVKFSLSLPALLAAGMVFEPPVAACLAFVGFLDEREWSGDFRFDRALANRAQVSLSVGAASFAFHALGGDLDRWPFVLGPAGVALAVDCAVNASVVAVGASFLYSKKPSQAGLDLIVGRGTEFFLAYSCLGALGLLIATTYLHIGVWALPIGMAPMFLAAEMLRRESRLLEAARVLEEKSSLLRAASEQAVLERADERNRIASAIHDDVLQSLHYLMLHAQVIREDLRHGRLLQLEEDVPVLLRTSQQTADLAREVVSGLRESPLGRGGAGPTLQLLCDELRDRFDGKIVADIGVVSASSVAQTYIYQVAREALVNAVRHSGGSRIELRLDEVGDEIRLRVADNGRGFDVAAGSPAGHFGISLMRERVDAAGGTMSVRSSIGGGTEIEALFPAGTERAGGSS